MSEEPETKGLVFAATKEYLRFGEFCDACRKYRYIGICHGVPGAGKTRSAREYARWDLLSPLFPEELFTLVGRRYLDDQFPHKPFSTPGSPAFTEVLSCRTVYYTAPVAAMDYVTFQDWATDALCTRFLNLLRFSFRLSENNHPLLEEVLGPPSSYREREGDAAARSSHGRRSQARKPSRFQ